MLSRMFRDSAPWMGMLFVSLISSPLHAGEPATTPRIGSLLIAGGGKMPVAVYERFIALAGGPSAHIVVIPTASRWAEQVQEMSLYATWTDFLRAGKIKSVAFLHTRKHDQANDPTFLKPLQQASGVWIGGGDQALLTDAYCGTGVERGMRQVLTRGGVVGGTSAGAAVMSSLMIARVTPVAESGPRCAITLSSGTPATAALLGAIAMTRGTAASEVSSGLGFLPEVIIDQHFQQRNRLARLLGVLNRHPKYLGIGIDEQTAIEVCGVELTVVGNNNVRVCVPHANQPTEVRILNPGDRIQWSETVAVKTTTAATPAPESPSPREPMVTMSQATMNQR